jgi:ABC-2 type transport system ATP-binding protein
VSDIYAIEVQDLTKYYGDLLAVDHISFDVPQGEVFGFLGPNGAGKTTTVRMLTTLLTPSTGTARILGYDVVRQSYHARRQIGLVPEESNVYDELTAWDNLMFTARLYRVPRGERERRAQELLETFGLQEKQKVKVKFFSKGMKRRLTIAMALIHRPAALFLDEPTPGLDAQSARAIKGLVRQLNAERTTVFLTTHYIEEANQLCDRVAIINHGQIAAIGTPQNLKRAFQSVQSVEVVCDGPADEAALRRLPGVTTVIKRGDGWRLYTTDPAALIPVLMADVQARNRQVLTLNTLGPSLEDVFLHITGQEVGTVRHPTTEKAAGRGARRRDRKGGRA